MPKPEVSKLVRTIVNRELRVAGHTWQGFSATHVYRLPRATPTTLADAKRIAGDFESLDSAEVVTIEQVIHETTTTQALE